MAETRKKNKILLVDDEVHVLEMLRELLLDDYETLLAASGPESLELVRQHKDIAVVVMDIKMAGMDGISAAREIRKMEPELPVIFHTGYPGDFDEDEINDKERPFDYVQKGDPVSKLTRSIRNAVESFNLKRNVYGLAAMAEMNYGMVGLSKKMQKVYQAIQRAAMSDTKVIIYGETGTGKEMVARAIHYNSRRKDFPFRWYNCNHVSSDLTESALFGHVKGAYTHAEDRKGLFEVADHGTVFLDEIGDMDLNTQEKLLRILEYGEYVKMGSPDVKKTDVRVLCATHRNLADLISSGLFRDDLYSRLDEVNITLPPLRERREDIPLLIERFKDKCVIEDGSQPKIFDNSAISVLIDYDWPRNVRQLRQKVTSIIATCESDLICAEDVIKVLHSESEGPEVMATQVKTLAQAVLEFKRNYIIKALQQTDNNISKAAKILGVDRANLAKLIKALGITIR